MVRVSLLIDRMIDSIFLIQYGTTACQGDRRIILIERSKDIAKNHGRRLCGRCDCHTRRLLELLIPDKYTTGSCCMQIIGHHYRSMEAMSAG